VNLRRQPLHQEQPRRVVPAIPVPQEARRQEVLQQTLINQPLRVKLPRQQALRLLLQLLRKRKKKLIAIRIHHCFPNPNQPLMFLLNPRSPKNRMKTHPNPPRSTRVTNIFVSV
jgi:hypothetical protein